MQLGVVLMFVGLGWCVFRKPIARRHAEITVRMLKLRAPLNDQQVRGMEIVGLLFCSLLFLAGLAITLLHSFLASTGASADHVDAKSQGLRLRSCSEVGPGSKVLSE